MRQMTLVPEPGDAMPVPRLRLSEMDQLCVAIQAGSPAELMERAEAALADSKFLELRLDSLPKPLAALPKVKEFLDSHRDATVIATCRRKQFGGSFDGALRAELEVLTKAAEAGCQIVDLEVESAEEAAPRQLDQLRAHLRAAGTALLVSFHDFTRTKGLEQAAERIEAFRPEFVKVVATAKSLTDNLAMLKLIEERSRSTHVVGISMGEEGVVSRILGLRAGASFTFASLDDGIETAPGQVSVRALRNLYRAEQLDQATRIFGVAGNPIAHSLSPLMHNTAFRRENVNAVLIPLKTHKLADLLNLARELPLAGVAVTMPLKQEVLAHLATSDPLTGRIGACNTLRMGADGKIVGFNTDVAGVVRPLEKRLRLKGAKIAVLGAGRRLRPGGSGRGGFHRQSHPRERREAGQGSQGPCAQARAVRQESLRCAHQLHTLRHGGQQAAAADCRGRTERRPGLRDGLQSSGDAAAQAGQRARHPRR
jgi:3-dehydroquinate dehydratase/shikimate dehydrogenase